MQKFEKPIAIDLFCGAGGLSLGAEMAGLFISDAIDCEINSINTYKRNHPYVNIIAKDIRKVRVSDVSTAPFIIFGGPPCQGFSYSNTKTRNIENLNNALYNHFIRFVRGKQPDWFVLENVAGIVDFDDGSILQDIKKKFTKLGYELSDKILYASDYGVPQKRNRYFLVGNKLGIKFTFPNKNRKTVTVWDAIADLPSIGNGANDVFLPYRNDIALSGYANKMRKGSKGSHQNFVSLNEKYIIDRYKFIRQGQNWRAIPSSLMKNYKELQNCHSGIYRRLRANKPSVVISNYRKNMLIHPYRNRGLSVREAARLQSFPDNFIFEGTIWYIQQQIGNAVPPLLAKAIFKRILFMTKKYSNGFK
jgi:DNA (cytosine-5)-methyltransferase 1